MSWDWGIRGQLDQLFHLVLEGLVRHQEVNKDGAQGERDEESPTKLPVNAHGDVEHEVDVSGEPFDAVDPGYTDDFDHGQEEDYEASAEEVDKPEDGLAARGDVEEPYAEAEDTDDAGDECLVPAGVHVADYGDDAACKTCGGA